MSLKGLSGFQKFDSEKFFKDKEFLFTKIEEWQEGEDADHMHVVGSKITGVIYQDSTTYPHDQKGINQGESITFKVRKPISAFNGWKVFQTAFVANEFEKVSIWGDFRNQLSVKVPSLQPVQN
ncbi:MULTISPECIES: hypothetical protein [Lactobacillus]|jgi:hypothetical protein|nr:MULTISPECIES: hypothetical protein [Bacteria]MBI1720213.1 hypothetical protein [Lactobacillus crispatus]MCZ9650108.1 hypothetical protein [Lactobacillus mulieris]MCZ9654168.1 hypothetical protein [Lactobacillus crispatus]MCZ9655719.1 hypothetical protein [Lactobacillus iners]MCZ9659262.1 hypothetical protein [Lactobacillus crispatus]